MTESTSKECMLSIVVPAYNVKAYIGECIESLIGQTYQELEIIIVDDGSMDGTGELCDWYAKADHRIQVLHQENRGTMIARNEGVRYAHGKWLTFVDGDDWVEPTAYTEVMEKAVDCEMLTFGVEREERNRTFGVTDAFEEKIYRGEALKHLMQRAIFDFESGKIQPLTPWLYNKIYMTEKMKAVVKACGDQRIGYAQDSVILYRYLLACTSVRICRRIYYHYRYRRDSSIHGYSPRALVDVGQVYLALRELFPKTEESLHLTKAFQKWITAMTCNIFENQLHFEKEVCPIQFILDTTQIKGKRVVLYGAGKCGRDFFRQMCYHDCPPMLWVDEDVDDAMGVVLHRPQELSDVVYEAILIAVSDGQVAKEIREGLIKMGVEKEKICWENPMRVYG